MQLASRGLIEYYLAELNEPKQRRARPHLRGGIAPTPMRDASRQRSRCTCGGCTCCVENARWERIFNEKFADPDYYCPRPATMGSSLSSWG